MRLPLKDKVLAILVGMAVSGAVLPHEAPPPSVPSSPIIAIARVVSVPEAETLGEFSLRALGGMLAKGTSAEGEPAIELAVDLAAEIPYVWPEPPAAESSSLHSEPSSFPRLIDQPGFWCDWNRCATTNCLFDVCGEFLRGPEAVLDCAAGMLQSLNPRPVCQTWEQCEQDPICLRVLDFQKNARQDGLFSTLLNNWIEREQRHFAGFADSELYTFEFEDGQADISEHRFRQKQRKIAWDALKRTYMGQYKFRTEQTLRDDAFQFNEWSGVDYALLPPMMATYIYYRGLDKKISVGPTRLTFSIEPLVEILHDDRDGALSLEWKVKGFPIGLLVSVGMIDRRAELEFIGIGTSLDAARKAVALQARFEDR